MQVEFRTTSIIHGVGLSGGADRLVVGTLEDTEMYVSLSLSTYLPTYLPIYLSTYRSIDLSIYLSIYLPSQLYVI